MKYFLYKILSRLGYTIYNKKKRVKETWKRLAKYRIVLHKDLLYNSAVYIFKFEDLYKDFSITENERFLIVRIEGLVFEIESAEEFLILSEIFIEKEYNFISDSECVLIDIGMNIGIASMFFSQKDFIKRIYGFEPVEDTYKMAVRNFENNDKIVGNKLFNFGLGATDRIEDFYYNKNLKGNSGIRRELSPSYNRSEIKKEVRKVNIRKASDVLQTIFNENSDLKIVIKMDCEGAEYEIIEELAQENLLIKIHIIIIEWHDHGAKAIEDYLLQNNFTIFSRSLGSISGLIYGKNNTY